MFRRRESTFSTIAMHFVPTTRAGWPRKGGGVKAFGRGRGCDIVNRRLRPCALQHLARARALRRVALLCDATRRIVNEPLFIGGNFDTDIASDQCQNYPDS